MKISRKGREQIVNFKSKLVEGKGRQLGKGKKESDNDRYEVAVAVKVIESIRSEKRREEMEFTEAFKQAGPCCFSPDSRLLAVAVDHRLFIRNVFSLKVEQLYSCVDKISFIEWAPDSQYVLCGLYKRPMVQAWSLAHPDWTCKIDEGPAGIAYARWSPDSRHILTTSDFQLRLTVWSLLNTACVHVQWPKHSPSFTTDGKFAAVCIRRDCKDYVNLLSCHSWELMGSFPVDTLDLAGLQWAPDDTSILVWDSLLEYKVLIYSPDGRCLLKYQPYDSGLGVKTLAWSPCGQFLAVGSYDQQVRALNHLTWKTFAHFMHMTTIRAPCNATIFKEVDEPLQLHMSDLSLSDDIALNIQDGSIDNSREGNCRVKYKVVDLPVNLPFQKPVIDKPNPKQGIGLMSWSCDSQYLLTRNDSMPTVLWIWDICRLEPAAVLIHKDPIRAAAWDPTGGPRLVLCTGSPNLYMWSPAGAWCVSIPLPEFLICDLKWSSAGGRLLLKSKETFSCAAFVQDLPDSTECTTSDDE
ncbi:WD repeat-containing protein WRAP73 [Rhynchospora pubera]|uniref:WD repeat-containing protein WRAP73 n=1 Tax=Rhynchospora pubera TaxID=906938 RepID=A0AAV8F8U4_9POAL|nr:WD repeat-containing protein WRAP73 [Rhynchospora pubera]